METTCLENDCDRRVRSRGRCGTHYEKWRLRNREKVTPKRGKWFNADGTRMTCAMPDCEFPVDSVGLCTHHYQNGHYMRTKGANKPRRNRKLTKYTGEKVEMTCTYTGCDRPEFNPGLCGGHYYQLKRTGELRPLHEEAPCPVRGCESTYFVAKNAQSMCKRHIALKGKYGMSLAQFLELHEKPGCHNPGCDYMGDDRHVDHDHNCCNRRGSCGKCVRGLLCRGCNSALGTTKEDPERIKGLLKYLSLN